MRKNESFRREIRDSKYLIHEEKIFNHIVLTKHSPFSIITILERKKPFFKKKVSPNGKIEYSIPGRKQKYTDEGYGAIKNCIKALKEYKKSVVKKLNSIGLKEVPKIPSPQNDSTAPDTAEKKKKRIKYSVGLSLAARDLIEFIGPKKLTSFSKNSIPSSRSRILKYGSFSSTVKFMELLIFGINEPQNVVLDLLIDDGILHRPNRTALLDDTYVNCGIGYGKHDSLKYVCSVILSSEYNTKSEYILSLPEPNVSKFLNMKKHGLDETKNLNVFPITQNKLGLWIKRGAINGERFDFKIAKRHRFELFAPTAKILFENYSYDVVFAFKDQPDKNSTIQIRNGKFSYEPYLYKINLSSDKHIFYHLRLKKALPGFLYILLNGSVVKKFHVERK